MYPLHACLTPTAYATKFLAESRPALPPSPTHTHTYTRICAPTKAAIACAGPVTYYMTKGAVKELLATYPCLCVCVLVCVCVSGCKECTLKLNVLGHITRIMAKLQYKIAAARLARGSQRLNADEAKRLQAVRKISCPCVRDIVRVVGSNLAYDMRIIK